MKIRDFAEDIENGVRIRGHSTSPPCGNLVDGLPHDCYLFVTWTTLEKFSPTKPSPYENLPH